MKLEVSLKLFLQFFFYRHAKVSSLIRYMYLVCSAKFFPQNVKTCIKSLIHTLHFVRPTATFPTFIPIKVAVLLRKYQPLTNQTLQASNPTQTAVWSHLLHNCSHSRTHLVNTTKFLIYFFRGFMSPMCSLIVQCFYKKN